MKIISKKRNDDVVLFEANSQEEIYDWLCKILLHFATFNFVNELNRMQSEVDIDLDNTSVFFKKTTIPIYFYNLILLRFGVEVVE